MRILRTPLGVTVLIMLLISIFNFTSHAEIANYIGVIVAVLFITIFIHELGHVFFGLWIGYRFNYLTIGPVTIENTDAIHIKVNDNWLLFGGITSCTPLSNDLNIISKQHKWFAAGGPIFSLVSSAISLTIGMIINMPLATSFGLANLIIFCVTIIPYKGSDGYTIMELTREGKQKEDFLVSLLLLKEMMSPTHPSNWSKVLIEHAKTIEPTVENVMVSYAIFYSSLITEGYDKATALLEPFKELTVTKQNKLSLQFISHIKQVDLIIKEDCDDVRIKNLHKFLNLIEPLSYKRSEAILAKLAGDDRQAKLKFREVAEAINKGKKHYGFFHAEELLTNILKNKLIRKSI